MWLKLILLSLCNSLCWCKFDLICRVRSGFNRWFQWTQNFHTTLDVEGNSIHYHQPILWRAACMRKLIAFWRYVMEITSFCQNSRRSIGCKVKALTFGQPYIFLLDLDDGMDHGDLWNLHGCKHGKVESSWSLLMFKWKWSKTIY